jgi:hypothetical protein
MFIVSSPATVRSENNEVGKDDAAGLDNHEI